MDKVPSTPLTPPIGGTVKPGGCCPPPPPPDYGCPVPGCPVPGNPEFHPPKPPCPPYPDPHEPGYWASDGDYPLPPANNYRPPKPPPERPTEPTVVPPPIPPVRYIPGMDVQEQLNHMANHVNQCVDRWNQIQHKCYEALDRVVGAAVSNDVYYEPDEVRFSSGYSSADGCEYHIIESRPVDKAGRPIKMRLMTAFNASSPTVRESITDKSFVSSANAIITAITPATQWKGLMIVGGNPQPTSPAVEGEWLCGWTRRGVLRLLPATETTVESACRNQIDDCIGPVIPIVMNGKPTQVAADFPAEPGAIQAIGWKQCNGNKVMFSCGFNDQPGCTVKNVADLLVSMGVTTAAVTCYMTGYGTPEIGGFVKQSETDAAPLNETASVLNVVGAAENVDSNLGVVPEPWTAQNDSLSGQEILGLTGGMAYIGALAENPIQFQLPQNAAFWVITKRPEHAGWANRWTGEIADICQRLGINATELTSVQGKLDLEQIQILDLQKRVGTLETNDKKQDAEIADHENRISQLETRMDTAETNIVDLQNKLAQEITDRIAGDDALRTALQQETDNRIDGDNKLNDRVNQLRTALTEEITARNQADQDLSNSILNEVNARIAGDTQLSTKIDLTKVTLENEIQKEAAARQTKDNDLQKQIDELEQDVNKINLKTGAGLREVVTATGERVIEAYLDSGLRFNNLQQIAINTGPGIKLENGRIVPNLGDCLTIDEEGRITMACCGNDSKLPLAGTGIDYGVDAQTGDVILNVIPPQNGEIGGVKAGAGVTISPDGTISAQGGDGEAYQLPPATKTTLGGVIIGDNINVDANGKISASSDYVLPVATPTVLGGVRVGKNLIIDQNGVLNADIPDLPAGEGDTVLAGDGIDVTKDAGERTATVSLNENTKGALNQVENNKNAIDTLSTRVTQLGNSTVSNTLFQTTVQGINQNVNKAQGDADAAQVSANQANAAASDAADLAQQAKETADNAAAAFVNALPLSGGNMTGDIDFTQQASARSEGGKPTVKGLPNPTEPDEAANKAYVDAAVSGADTSGLMPKSGGTFTGNVTMGTGASINGVVTPTAESQAANKGYVDSLKPDIAAANSTAEAASTKADSAASTAASALQQSSEAITKANQATTAATAAHETADAAKTAAEAASSAVEGGPFLPLSGGTVSGVLTMGESTSFYAQPQQIQFLYSKQGNGTPFTFSDETHAAIEFNAVKGTNRAYLGPVPYAETSQKKQMTVSVPNPTVWSDAANKLYVDDQIAGVSNTEVDTSTLVKKSGDTMTGPLTLSGAPTANLQAATKKYVDDAVSGSSVDTSGLVSKTGDTMTGNLTTTGNLTGKVVYATGNSPVSGSTGKTLLADGTLQVGCSTGTPDQIIIGQRYNSVSMVANKSSSTGVIMEGPVRISGVDAPTNNEDAANKQYVDSKLTATLKTPSNMYGPSWSAISTLLYAARTITYTLNTSQFAIDTYSTLQQLKMFTRNYAEPVFKFTDTITLPVGKTLPMNRFISLGSGYITRNYLINEMDTNKGRAYYIGQLALEGTYYFIGDLYLTLSKLTSSSDVTFTIDLYVTTDVLTNTQNTAVNLAPVGGRIDLAYY